MVKTARQKKRLVCVLKPSDRVGVRLILRQFVGTIFRKQNQCGCSLNHDDSQVPQALKTFRVNATVWKDTHKLVLDSVQSAPFGRRRRHRRFVLEELCRSLNEKYYTSLGLQVQPYDHASFRERPRHDVTGILFYAVLSQSV